MEKKRILFLCVENACRSQIAEAFARTIGEYEVEAYSAGSRPSGEVDPLAIQVMAERGIGMSGQRSKGVDAVRRLEFDCVVTMGCGDECPTLRAKAVKEWKVPDPKGRPIEFFRSARDKIEAQVWTLLQELQVKKVLDQVRRP